MKQVIQLFAAWVAAFLLLWLFGGFVAMDWDPVNWTIAGRFMLVWISFVALVLFLAAPKND